MNEIELISKAKETGRLKYWTMVYYEITKLEAQAGQEKCKLLQDAHNKLKELRENATNAYWGFMSLRPKDGLTIDEFMAQCEQLCSKLWLKNNHLLVYEQKGKNEEEMGKGMHAHILFKMLGVMHGKDQKSKNQVLNEFHKTIKTFKRPDCWFEQSVDLDLRGRKEGRNSQKYLIGKKASAEKQEIQKIDKIWRAKYNIEPYYGKVWDMKTT